MCLILLAYDAHPLYRLILAANRDEFFSRPTAPAAFRDDSPQILAGRDLKEGGTWLGLTRTGRIAAITNYRDPRSERKDAPSRGGLVSGFLAGSMSVEEYLAFLKSEGTNFNGFNLIFGDMKRLCWFSNRGGEPQFLQPGIHGLSNHLLDTPWPKVSRGKEDLERIVAQGKNIEPDALFAILADRTIPRMTSFPTPAWGLNWKEFCHPDSSRPPPMARGLPPSSLSTGKEKPPLSKKLTMVTRKRRRSSLFDSGSKRRRESLLRLPDLIQ